jgi:hypothetical protein
MKFALGDCGPSGDKCAWYYTACLKRYYNARVKPEDLLARVAQDGGMRAIYDAELAARKKAQKEMEESLEAARRIESDDDQATHSSDDDLWRPKKAEAGAEKGLRSVCPPR